MNTINGRRHSGEVSSVGSISADHTASREGYGETILICRRFNETFSIEFELEEFPTELLQLDESII